MFMRNVEFANEKLKYVYKGIINDHRGVAGIILSLIKDGEGIIIKDIVNEAYTTQLVISKNNDIYTIDIDLLKKKLYYKEPGRGYKIIYNDFPRKEVVAVGHLYQNNERSIEEFFLLKFHDEIGNVRHIEVNDNGKHYVIIFQKTNKSFDEEVFINRILYSNIEYNTIRDLFLAINSMININDVNIKLGDSKGSNIIIENGMIKNYIEYQDMGEYHQKIYLENDNFFIEKKVKEEYQDEVTSLVRKIGVKNGKEKR